MYFEGIILHEITTRDNCHLISLIHGMQKTKQMNKQNKIKHLDRTDWWLPRRRVQGRK